MLLKKSILLSTILIAPLAYAMDNGDNVIPALANGVNIPQMQQCMKSLQACNNLKNWERKNSCETKQITQLGAICSQTQAIMQKLGVAPNQVQAIGPVTLFTQYHSGDAKNSYHMVDKDGRLINLVWDAPESFSKNPQWTTFLKKYAGAGLTDQLVNNNVQYVIPGAIAKAANTDNALQIIFTQSVRKPACMACDQVGVADVAYRFSYPEGKFLDIQLLKIN